MTLNIVFGWDSVDRDLCLQGADIVLWQQYINPLRTHEPCHCPLLVKGQPESYRAALPARQPQGSSTGKTLAIMGDWTWTFPNHYISVLPVDQFKQEHLLTLCDGSSSEFIPSCFFNIFFFFFCQIQVLFLQSVCIYFKSMAHLLRLRHAARWLEPPSFISPLRLSDSLWSLGSARDYLIVPSGSSNSLLIPALPLFKQARGSQPQLTCSVWVLYSWERI